MAYAYPIYNKVVGGKSGEQIWGKNTGYDLTSGPKELKDISKKNNKTKYYCLDLINKYHRESKLKSFHTVTFWFRNSKGDSNLSGDYETTIIRAQVPEQISYSIGGEWGAPEGAVNIGGSLIGQLAETLTGESGVSVFDVTRIWKKPKPLSIKLDIPIFDDVDSESGINLQEALYRFGQVILPGGENWASMYKVTPGPGFMAAANKAGEDPNASNMLSRTAERIQDSFGCKKGLDRVTVQIGGMLLLDWAAITDMTVTYPNTKQQVLHNWINYSKYRKFQLLPQVATISLVIETVTGLTTIMFRNMLNLTTQDEAEIDQGNSTGSGSVQGGTTQLYGFTDALTGNEVGDKDYAGYVKNMEDREKMSKSINTYGGITPVNSGVVNQDMGYSPVNAERR